MAPAAGGGDWSDSDSSSSIGSLVGPAGPAVVVGPEGGDTAVAGDDAVGGDVAGDGEVQGGMQVHPPLQHLRP